MRDAHTLTPTDRFQYTPTLSCVMPAYNEGKNLGTLVPQVLQALQALGSQVEIVLINDGSRDDTAQVIEAQHTAKWWASTCHATLAKRRHSPLALTPRVARW
jgi:cellulose synthase/poly-beta-1,6-N-acetylglucosamine synthase-like glycosyltransferase